MVEAILLTEAQCIITHVHTTRGPESWEPLVCEVNPGLGYW
jgi:hypothetical protein